MFYEIFLRNSCKSSSFVKEGAGTDGDLFVHR